MFWNWHIKSESNEAMQYLLRKRIQSHKWKKCIWTTYVIRRSLSKLSGNWKNYLKEMRCVQGQKNFEYIKNHIV